MIILGDQAAVKMNITTTSEGGIMLPEGGKKAPVRSGVVTHVGIGEEIAKYLGVTVGAKVLIYFIGRHAFPEIPGEENTFIVPQEAILAVLDKD